MAHPLELLVELHQATADVALHGAEGQADLLGDLGVAVTLPEGEEHDGAAGIWQVLDGLPDHQSFGDVLVSGLVGVVVGHRQRHHGREPVGLTGPGGSYVGHLVAGDPHQPGRQRGGTRGQRVPAAPRSDEHLLGDVLRVMRIAEGAQRVGVHERRPPVVDLLERDLVTRHEPSGERLDAGVLLVLERHRLGDHRATVPACRAGGERDDGHLALRPSGVRRAVPQRSIGRSTRSMPWATCLLPLLRSRALRMAFGSWAFLSRSLSVTLTLGLVLTFTVILPPWAVVSLAPLALSTLLLVSVLPGTTW